MRIPAHIIEEKLSLILKKYGFNNEKATRLATAFTNSSIDGYASHGVNRFARFIQNVKDGIVKINAEPVKVNSVGNLEQWDGNLGPGVLNAITCMNRAMEIAAKAGIGCVALKNTNHWMRGGTYGWQAAENGFLGICWTNTKPNMVAWGGRDIVLGNNPLVMGIPGEEGHIVLDMAVSQYSFGKMQEIAEKGIGLRFPGGWDKDGKLTTDPKSILATEKTLPMGYWKGSALSMMLDIVAAVLSGGETSSRIGKKTEEFGLSQVFMAVNLGWIDPLLYKKVVTEVITYVHTSNPVSKEESVYYPGEKTLKNRKLNGELGIQVNEHVWEEILRL